MKFTIHTFDLPLRHTFTISRGSISVQPTLIVELEEAGVRGYGEATASDFYGVSLERMISALESVRPQVEVATVPDPPARTAESWPVDFWEQLHSELLHEPFAHCALDQAAHDLWGKRRGQPVYKLWGLHTTNLPVTNYTIGIDSIDVMVAKMDEFPGWPVYKIKLGTAHDLEIIRELRKHTDSVFRVDANCGWSADETIRNSHDLRRLNVEFIEQPLAADDRSGMRKVHAESALPVIADESCQVEADVDACHGHFHGINIKLVKCGGLTPARRMIARARQLGMKVMVGCMTESTIGISAIAQLLPLLDYVDMDGALLLAADIATGVSIEQGVCRFPTENGCGIRLTGLRPREK